MELLILEELKVIRYCLMTLTVCAVITLLVNTASIWVAIGKMDDNAEYRRGKLEAQSLAHQFIRERVNPDTARRYYLWLQEGGKR